MDTPPFLEPPATAPLVALDRIVPDPNQPRKTFPEGPLQELAESLWSQGLTQPITLTADPEGGPDVIFVGERRYRAFDRNRQRASRLLEQVPDLPPDHPARWYKSWTEIPALHHPPMPAHLRLLRQLAENDTRDGLTLYERSLALYDALKLSGMQGKDFAAEHGLSTAQVSTAKSLVNAKGFTKLALERGILRSPDAAREFMKIPADLQEALIEEATESESVLTRPMLAKYVEELERAKDLESKARPASPPTRSSPSSKRPEGPDAAAGPVMNLGTLLWLEEKLRPESSADPEPQQLAAHAVLNQAILRSSAYIAISETEDEHRSPSPVEESALQEA